MTTGRKRTWIVLSLALMAVLGLACLATYFTGDDVALATWVQALATIAAFAAAGFAATQVSRTLRIERDREERDRTERERRQASQVAAWWPDWQRSQPLHVTLVNGSSVPVFDLEVIAELENGSLQRVKREPQLHPTFAEPWLRELTSAPAKAWLKERYSHNRSAQHKRWVQPRVWIQFRDAEGQEWTRDVLGRLVKGRAGNFDDVEHHVRAADGRIVPAPDAKPRTGGWEEPSRNQVQVQQ